MNIHPLFVHLPIGLLTAYSFLEMSASIWPAVRRQSWLFPVNAFLLFAGALGAFAALVTGGIAEDLIETTENSNPAVIGTHSAFAAITTLLYLILAAAYLVRIFQIKGWGQRLFGSSPFFGPILRLKEHLTHLVLDTWVLPVLAFIAFVSLIVTGALGASIVYGPNADFIVSFIYHLFWAQ